MKKLIIFLVSIIFICGCTSELSNYEETTTETITTKEVYTTTVSTTEIPTEATTEIVTTKPTTTTKATTVKPITTKRATTTTTSKKVVNQGRKIYRTPTGKKYHYDNNCNGGTYYETTLEEAINSHFEPCKKCVLK